MSAPIDRFVSDRLPAREQWPQFVYDGLPGMDFPQQLNLVDALFARAEAAGHGDRPMLRSPQRALSYREARLEVDRIAQVLLQDLALVPGNRVLLRGGNSVEMALAWLGVVKAGLVALATMPLLRARELSDIMEKAQPSAALCDGRLMEELEAARALPAGASLRTVLRFNAPEDAG
ncbi:MAG: AMP-binding protein, partial [Proteobacteria bacterium]|nr:AMP-binding protein [Pseudomonadota bacterium]